MSTRDFMSRKALTDFAVRGEFNGKRKMHEVQERSRNQGWQGSHDEEWHEGYERCLRHLRHKSV